MLCKAHIATLATKTTNPGRAWFCLQAILNYFLQHPCELGFLGSPGQQAAGLLTDPGLRTPDPMFFLFVSGRGGRAVGADNNHL